jgi:hypothetical protein
MTEDKIIYECQKNKPLMVALFKLNKINKWYEKKLNLMEKEINSQNEEINKIKKNVLLYPIYQSKNNIAVNLVPSIKKHPIE